MLRCTEANGLSAWTFLAWHGMMVEIDVTTMVL